ncbi:MAG TPA: hypothetical protein VMM60_07500 [Ilumatobacter sp.]|nr:hypothetical protein [Ilumatobacter sp.]
MNRLAALVVVVALISVACGDEEPLESTVSVAGSSATAAPATTVSATASTSPASTVPAATSPTTTGPSTSPTSTSPTTTVPATTVVDDPTGWMQSDFQPAAYVLGYSGNWDGPPSPAAPNELSETPGDGFYAASLIEPWEPGDTTLRVRVQRLEYCTLIPGGCDYYEEGSNELNLDPTWQLVLDVRLDSTSSVVVTGFSCFAAAAAETKRATGADLADLFTSFAADYETAILPSVLQGVPSHEVAEAVAAAPTGGFVGEVDHCGEGDNGFAGPLRYVHEDAPVLLLQTVTGWNEETDEPEPMQPTDLIGLQGVEYIDGVPTFYFYAGFYS